jgi:hypothetical protein
MVWHKFLFQKNFAKKLLLYLVIAGTLNIVEAC